MRIVSLLPSATEILCALGLRDNLVGVTHECDYPPDVCSLPSVTITHIPTDASSAEIDGLVREQLKTRQALYSLKLDVLETLRPDLIVTQALCDVCAVAEDEVTAAACSLPGRPKVINLEPENFEDVLQCIQTVGEAAGVAERASEFIDKLRERVNAITSRHNEIKHRPGVALLEWLDPLFTSGHWSPELVAMAGGRELVGRAGARSRTLSWQELRDTEPDVLFIACCGFTIERTLEDLPLVESLPGWRDLPAVRSGRVYIVDGSAYFSRPGPRLVDSLEILAHALHPMLFDLPVGLEAAKRHQAESSIVQPEA